ncbi:hypothetical protein NDU88_006114 [Pleurodeles waltl]|uniref:Uncharacterized protein n=1 Tax=Pleurodeles waltl TaxID=8319 RepID=A0AAV7VQH4_PLEWA|nr:hypothetical protein NDU88_006114 [Pleurodeles waltl]
MVAVPAVFGGPVQGTLPPETLRPGRGASFRLGPQFSLSLSALPRPRSPAGEQAPRQDPFSGSSSVCRSGPQDLLGLALAGTHPLRVSRSGPPGLGSPVRPRSGLSPRPSRQTPTVIQWTDRSPQS